MAKNQINHKKAAKEFADFWQNKGDEKQHTQLFWTSLLRNVFGIEKPETVIDFEKRVKINGTKYIDAYIAATNAAIEQKSLKTDLDKKELQSDGTLLTPYEQAKRYNDNLRYSERCRWIVVSNFAEFRIYDMEKEEPEKHFGTVLLENLSNNFDSLRFLVDSGKDLVPPETQVSLKAGELVGKLYDALIKEYINPDENSFRSLNILCVRIVFCLYAEDAGLFETRTAFEDYIKSFSLENLRRGLMDLFKILNTKPENRDKYDTKINSFPYVNGGLFADDTIEIPNFTKEIVDVLVNHCAPFDWSKISPTIFGAVFESTLNPETRRKGGMHYTSIENIHKVIDPLFLDDLRAEFHQIVETFPETSHKTSHKTKTVANTKETCQVTSLRKRRELEQFRDKIASLTFLDPACGSGNFLTETYISLRRLENEILRLIHGKQQLLGSDFSPIKVKISQFYGIEINDFAVTVAKTALWIAESQMMKETEEIVEENLDFLPLSTSATIVEGNALRMDWATLKSDDESNKFYKIFAGFSPETDGIEHHYDYIMGNPPFVGTNYLSDAQRADMDLIWDNEERGKLDFVSCWYVKSAHLLQNTNTKCAFVSTNSITQGEQATSLWKKVFEKNMTIDFAYRTFRWDSESTLKAKVHCVIVGFSDKKSAQKQKLLFDEKGQKIVANNINHYLLDAPSIFIEEVSKPLCNVPAIMRGSQATDDGYYLFTEEEMADFIKKYPNTEQYFKQFMMGKEFINNIKRYCLWIPDISPKELKEHKGIYERVQKVKVFRETSKNKQTQAAANTPNRFGQYRPPAKQYIAFAKVSSERRRYIPFGFLTDSVIPGDKLFTIPNATLFHFGVLTSSVHMAWMRAVCGRLKSDYSYSTTIVYNNFPWPDVETSPETSHKRKTVANAKETSPETSHKTKTTISTKETFQETSLRDKVEQTAQAILDARAKYPDSSLADLYDETTMPADLRKAHRENDKAVMSAYGFDPKMSESEIVAELFKMYEKLTK